MKRILSLALAFVLILSLTACGSKTYNVGDTVSTKAAELTVTSVRFEKQYRDVFPEDGGFFVVVSLKIRNIGSEKLSMPYGPYFGDIVTVLYGENKYAFAVDRVVDKIGESYGKSIFDSSDPYTPLIDLKPLSEAQTGTVAIHVPAEVAENTDEPLVIRVEVPSGDSQHEIFMYNIR